MKLKIKADIAQLRALAAKYDLDMPEDGNITFSAGDIGYRLNVRLESGTVYEMFLSSRDDGVKLTYLVITEDKFGSPCTMNRHYDVSAELLEELGIAGQI